MEAALLPVLFFVLISVVVVMFATKFNENVK